MTLIDRIKGDHRPVPRQRLQLFPLRTYQREALEALAGTERELVVLPTGGGKTVVFAHKAARFIADNPGQRVIVLVHTDELVEQAFKALVGVAPHLNCGIVKARRRDVFADVIVASVQTLRQPAALRSVTCVGLIITDEADLSVAASYMTIFTHFGAFDGKVGMAGFTATPFRADGKSLYPLWQKVAYARDISWMVRRKYLIPPKGKAVEVPDLDLRTVKATRADYRDGELGEALAESLAPGLVVEAWLEHASTRKTLGFAPTVASAYVFAEAFTAAGIAAEVVHGGLPKDERKRLLAEHRAGKFPVLFNCQILTVGYDDPGVECIIMARPTKSKRLYIQIIGRGLRVNPEVDYDLQDCLILDVVGASAVHGDLRSLADLSDRKLTEKDAHSGKTLVDLEDEFDAGEGIGADQPTWYEGPVVTRDFDPLGNASTKVWIKTAGGTYFVPAGQHAYVFIMQWPEPGQWSVAWCAKEPSGRYALDAEGVPRPDPKGRPVGMTEHRGLPLEQAMVWAEDLAVDLGADSLNTASRKAYWRKKPASEKMLSFARGLGVKLTEERDEQTGLVTVTMKAGEVSDLITKIMGTRRIDPLVRKVREQ